MGRDLAATSDPADSAVSIHALVMGATFPFCTKITVMLLV